MPKNESSSSSSHYSVFRVVAVLVLFLSVIVVGLQVLGILAEQNRPEGPSPLPGLLIAPILVLVSGIAASTALEGIARLVGRIETKQADPSSVAIARLSAAIAQLQATLPTLVAIPHAVPEAQAVYADEQSTPPEPVQSSNVEQYLERMVKLLEEMKEVSMLDDAQRLTRKQQTMNRRKMSRLEDASRLIHQRNWEEADALLHLLESLHPGDPDVLAKRNELDDARIVIQADEWEMLTRHVEDLLALSRYDEATQALSPFLERYPNHTDCQSLLQRVQQEGQIYVERNSSRLYDEIKLAVESRQWRAALAGIQRFLEQYPENSRANKIRQQVQVIQKNAEIEERHEQEDRIRDLITARQYAEAADLSEDLLQKFPDSPQASYLTELLPKLRRRTAVEVEDAISE